MELKYFFAKETATFIDGPATRLNNLPKNPLDWIILNNRALDNFISVDISFSNAFFNFVFRLVLSDNLWGKLFLLNILICILKVRPCLYLTADFSLFNCEFDNLAFTLLYCFNHLMLALQYFCCSFVKIKDCFF